MKWISVIVICVLVLNSGGLGVGNEQDLEEQMQVQYQVPQRGVQDFSDGSIAMVEKEIEITEEDEYYSVSGVYYNCSLKKDVPGRVLTFQVGDASIVYDIPAMQPFWELKTVEGFCEKRGGTQEGRNVESLVYEKICEGIDLKYTFLHHKVLEEVILERFKHVQIVQHVSVENVWLSEKEGGIYFYHEKTGRLAFFIPPPAMYEEKNPTVRCYDIHYEVKSTGDTYVIRKVIDKQGLEWLKDPERVYPVVIDSTTEGGIADPWEESGLLPYGQYFKNVNEYVSPVSGSLTVSQTDLFLPGRGMDLAITRVYTTPQLFDINDGFEPVEEDPPWTIANGWRFDFPGIKGDHLYLWGGRMYTLEWGNDPPDCPYWCFPPVEPEEDVFNNHKGDHFRLIKHVDSTYTLYLKDGRVLKFSSSGNIQSIEDVHGNKILFSGSTITDTVGRVVTVSASGIFYEGKSVDYTIQYIDYKPVLTGVTDFMGRVTQYHYEHANKWLLTRVVYPTQGYTEYVYGMKERRICHESCSVWNKDCHEVPDCYQKTYQFRVVTQKVYAESLVKVRTFSYVEDWENTLECTEITKDELYYIQSKTHFTISNGKIKTRTVTDYNGNQIEKVVYSYNGQGDIVLTQTYKGETDQVTYQEFSQYDEWGNQVYYRNGLGHEQFASYSNTSSEGVFTDYSGEVISLFSNQFYANSTDSVYNRVAGTCSIQGECTVENHYLYDNAGNMIESKDIYEGKSYLVYSGVFDENGQTVFTFDSGTPVDDAILRIASIPTLNTVHKSETHSVSTHPGYHNAGYWQNNYFYAHWIRSIRGEIEEGYDPVGPFTHYPGTEGYQNYQLWVSGLTQYVKTTYETRATVSPAACNYRINSSTWTQITSDLQNNTAQIIIPREDIVQENTLEFQESSRFTTRFQWTLFVPVIAEPETYHKSYQYDSYGNLVAATNGYGTVMFEYGPEYQNAYMTAVTDPLGQRISCEYDTTGNITSITDAEENHYQYEYDLLNRLVKKINPDLSEREAAYDDVNNSVTIYDELDHFVKKYFDGLGRITKTEYGQYTERYTYNYLGKIEIRINPSGAAYTYEYDPVGRITKSVNPDGTFTQWVYNDIQNTVSVYDENLSKTEYTYDWNGNLLSVKEYINQDYYVTGYEYDESKNVTKVTDAKGNTTVYKYGIFGLTRIVYPDATEELFTYDCIGNVIKKTTGSNPILYHYNAASQLTQVEYPDSSVTYTYDANGNRISMQDEVSSAVYVYDARNRQASETKTIDGTDYTLSYMYDAASNLLSITYPNGTVINQNYDDLNRITSVEGYAQFSWDENSQIEKIVYQNGVTTNYTYDVLNRPTQVRTMKNGSDLLNLNYLYDPAGNILQIRDTPNDSLQEQWDYSYDSLNRLVTAVGGPVESAYLLNYTYDATGNRIQLNNTLYTYNEMNELLTQQGDINCTYTYDEYGNCITKDGVTTWDYYYDHENRLSSVTENGQVTQQYVYDGDGKRIKKTDSESVRIYIYSGLNVLYEVNMTTHMDGVYIYGPTGRIAKKVNDIIEYYHTDHLGSTRLTTSENGAPVTEVRYKPFGKQTSTTEEQYTYNGKELDTTGFYYYGARYYDPETGRFLTRDPLNGTKVSPQTLNRYVYCLNNPLVYIDPAGTEPQGPQQAVEEAFKRLQYIDPDDLSEIQTLLDTGNQLEAFMRILELLGFEFACKGDNTLSVKIGGGLYTMNIVHDLKVNGQDAWGATNNSENTIFINFSRGKVGDVTLTVLHEVSHAILGGTTGEQIEREHQFIFGVEYSYMVALGLCGVEFSKDFRADLEGDVLVFDPEKEHRVPVFEIMKRWTQGWKIR
jgi:RHS repeat-associated protein